MLVAVIFAGPGDMAPGADAVVSPQRAEDLAHSNGVMAGPGARRCPRRVVADRRIST